MPRITRALATALVLAVALCALVPPGPARAAHKKPCSKGMIALTFDDGPSPTVTPHLVRTLLELKVPATFFMVGSRVQASPVTARLVMKSGFQIGNHTWSHPELTTLSDTAVVQQLKSTAKAFRDHYVTASRLMRPPYGDINDRVRRDVKKLGLHPVLWTNDSRDWAGGTSMQIAHRILVALRPNGTNLVLQHDGVENSPNSVGAVPIVVRAARSRGYCFTNLTRVGTVATTKSFPVPQSRRAAAARRAERRAEQRRRATSVFMVGVPGRPVRPVASPLFRVLFALESGPVVPKG